MDKDQAYMRKDIGIREASPDDIPEISRLISELAQRYIVHEFSSKGVQSLLSALNEDAIRSYLQVGYRYHVAVAEHSLAGVAATRDNRHLYHLFVADEYRRRGLATRLWQVARDACMAVADTREFTVNSSRHAIGFYEKLGFMRHGDFQEHNGVIWMPMKLIVTPPG